MIITVGLAESDVIPGIESFLTTLWLEREYTRKSGVWCGLLALQRFVSMK
jgi:hypothetical protein